MKTRLLTGRVAELLAREQTVGSGVATVDRQLAGVHPGPVRDWRLLEPVRRRVAAEQLVGVDEPERVVGVEHEVGALELGHLVERHEAGVASARLVDPLVERVAAVEQDDAVVEGGLGDRLGGDVGAPRGDRLVDRFGVADVSAYQIRPSADAAIVFTHGMPCHVA